MTGPKCCFLELSIVSVWRPCCFQSMTVHLVTTKTAPFQWNNYPKWWNSYFHILLSNPQTHSFAGCLSNILFGRMTQHSTMAPLRLLAFLVSFGLKQFLSLSLTFSLDTFEVYCSFFFFFFVEWPIIWVY